MKRKSGKPKPRLPMEAVATLGKGRPHGTKKGKKGYDRKRDKREGV